MPLAVAGPGTAPPKLKPPPPGPPGAEAGAHQLVLPVPGGACPSLLLAGSLCATSHSRSAPPAGQPVALPALGQSGDLLVPVGVPRPPPGRRLRPIPRLRDRGHCRLPTGTGIRQLRAHASVTAHGGDRDSTHAKGNLTPTPSRTRNASEWKASLAS